MGPHSDRYWQIKIIKKHKSSGNSTFEETSIGEITFVSLFRFGFCLFGEFAAVKTFNLIVSSGILFLSWPFETRLAKGNSDW